MRVLFVCLGNICRSPMAEAMFAEKLRKAGVFDAHTVDSAGTVGHHVGEDPDPRTLATLRRHGIPRGGVARRLERADGERFDLILTMDRNNLRDVRARLDGTPARIEAVLAPVGGGDVPDPYYDGDAAFEAVYRLLEPALDAWVAEVVGG